MVTKEFAQGLGVTVAAVVGLLVGFKVQDEVARRREVRAVWVWPSCRAGVSPGTRQAHDALIHEPLAGVPQ